MIWGVNWVNDNVNQGLLIPSEDSIFHSEKPRLRQQAQGVSWRSRISPVWVKLHGAGHICRAFLVSPQHDPPSLVVSPPDLFGSIPAVAKPKFILIFFSHWLPCSARDACYTLLRPVQRSGTLYRRSVEDWCGVESLQPRDIDHVVGTNLADG
jgi:hypothetical protein